MAREEDDEPCLGNGTARRSRSVGVWDCDCDWKLDDESGVTTFELGRGVSDDEDCLCRASLPFRPGADPLIVDVDVELEVWLIGKGRVGTNGETGPSG